MAGGTRSFEMARRMVEAGHRVQMITSYRVANAPVKTGQWFETEEQGIHVHWLVNPYSNKMGFRERIASFLRFALRAGNKAASLKGDIVFATSTPLTIAIPALYAKRRMRIPMVFEVRDLWPDVPMAMGIIKNPVVIRLAKRLEKMAYFGANHVVALSPDMARGIEKTGYPSNQISVIPNSSDTALFRVPVSNGEAFLSKHPFLKGGPVVLYAGTLGRVNGVDYLVHIAKHMLSINPRTRFLVVGKGSEDSIIRQLAEQEGILEKNFWMLGQVSKSEMPAILSACSLSCSLVIDNTALWANSANKAFDTFAAERPLAINHGGWLANVLTESKAGIVVHATDSHLAAQQINDFLMDTERIMSARKAAKLLAEERFNRDILAKNLMGIIEEVAATQWPATRE